MIEAIERRVRATTVSLFEDQMERCQELGKKLEGGWSGSQVVRAAIEEFIARRLEEMEIRDELRELRAARER